MALVTLTPERIQRELARSAAGERAHRTEVRRLWGLAGILLLCNALQTFFWGLSMHLVGDESTAAMWTAAACAPLPLFVLIIAQARRKE